MSMSWLDSLVQDIAYAIRSLRRAPALTAGVILTLALGLGVNMAMFSFLDVVYLRAPAAVHRPDEVRRAWVEITFQSGPQFWSGFSYPQYAAIRTAVGDRVASAMYLHPRSTRFGPPDAESQVRLSYATSDYFDVLGVRPSAGRFFTADEDRLGSGANVAVASHAWWRKQFAGEAAALGREIQIGARRYTLIGVAAETFTGVELDATEVWVPMASQVQRGPTPWWTTHNVNGFQILLRPGAGSGIGDAALEQRIGIGLRSPQALQRPADTASVVQVGSIIRAQGPGHKEQEVKIATRLAIVTAIVLLITCANVINLLLARALKRRREIAVRLAVGISRARLVRLLLTESVLLASAAAGAATLCAYWGGVLLRSMLLPDVQWPDAASPAHWRMIALAMAAGIGAGLLAGLFPAFESARTDLNSALKASSTASDGRGSRSRLRSGLVVIQAALSVVLLVGAGLFVSSLRNVRGLRIGYDTPRIVFGEVQYDTRDSVNVARRPQAVRELADRLRGSPGVEQVALAFITPTYGFSFVAFHPDVDTTRYKKPFATYNLVSPEFFDATGMRVLRGSGFPRNVGGGMPPVVVVNEAMANAQWPGMEAVGRCLRFSQDGECYRVVGVVETAIFRGVVEKREAQYYLPVDNPPDSVDGWFGTLVVRTREGARDQVSAQLQRSIRDAFPGGRPLIRTLEQLLEPEYRPWRTGASLFSAMGLLALIVAAMGIYSTVAYTVAQRTQEFGVRTALGARMVDILRHVLAGSLRTVTLGIVLGIVLAVAGGRFVASLLYGIDPGDPGVMFGVVLTLLLIATLAALGPAWRAARVDPVTALRME